MKIYSTGIHEALERLARGEGFAIGTDGSYESLVWYSAVTPKPSKEQVEMEIAAVLAEHSSLEYQRLARLRASEYPPIGDQLDALWKGGDAAAEMLARVQAVKTKYPKPE